MFALFGKRPDRWTRRTPWTPLLSSQRSFQRILSKERSRVERSGNSFGFIILRLESLNLARRQTVRLAKLLHKRLRDTDEKGHLGIGRIGVVLPDTTMEETELVLNQILKIAGNANLKIDGEAFSYPDRHDDVGQTPESSESEKLEPVGSNAGSDSLSFMTPGYPRWKRAMDVIISGTSLVLFSPVFILVALCIKLTSKGPVIFAQERTGQLFRTFTIYKFRTMIVNAEELQAQLIEANERDGPAFISFNELSL